MVTPPATAKPEFSRFIHEIFRFALYDLGCCLRYLFPVWFRRFNLGATFAIDNVVQSKPTDPAAPTGWALTSRCFCTILMAVQYLFSTMFFSNYTFARLSARLSIMPTTSSPLRS